MDIRRTDLDPIRTAHEVMRRLLDQDQRRVRHSEAVAAARARSLGDTVAEDEAGLLVVAALLHDVGYSDRLNETGCHPLDGARYLSRTCHSKHGCATCWSVTDPTPPRLGPNLSGRPTCGPPGGVSRAG